MVAHEVCHHMAQTTVPVYLSGKLGSMVYTGNRQGTAVRMLVTPKNPETAVSAIKHSLRAQCCKPTKCATKSVPMALKLCQFGANGTRA
jgi:hypothetical protein